MADPKLLNQMRFANQNNDEKNVYCRILHLSDLHITIDPRYTNVFNSFVERLNTILKKFPVDCIVITGDIFHKGVITEATINEAKNRIKQVYQICSDTGVWGYRDPLPLDRLFYCPGNHDLLRNCAMLDPKTGTNVLRQTVVKEQIEKEPAYIELDHNSAQYKVLVSAFEQFYTMMHGLRNDNADQSREVEVFRIDSNGDGANDPSICFTALNTAFLAGYAETVEEVTMKQAWLKLQCAWEPTDRCEAAKQYHELLEKAIGEKVNDEQRLCLPISSNESTEIANKLNDFRHLSILIGHHNLDYLNHHAKTEMMNAAQSLGASLYLCGHTHRPSNEDTWSRILFQNEHDIGIRVASSAYYDENDYYNVLGFTLHTIYKEGTTYQCETENHVYLRLLEKWEVIRCSGKHTLQVFEPATPREDAHPRSEERKENGQDSTGEDNKITKTAMEEIMKVDDNESGEMPEKRKKEIDINDLSDLWGWQNNQPGGEDGTRNKGPNDQSQSK